MARRHTSLRLLLATALLALIPLGGWWSWVREGPLQSEVTVLVPRGTTVGGLAERLESQGVIRSATIFKLWARQRKLQLIRGEYTFAPRASLETVAGTTFPRTWWSTTATWTSSGKRSSAREEADEQAPPDRKSVV